MPAIYPNLQSKCIEIIQFVFMCTIYTLVQINLHHLEGRSKFAHGCKFAPRCKFLKHHSHGPKYTPGANLHPRVQICTRVQIAHMNVACMIPLLSISEISSLWPSSVAVQPGLCRTRSETTMLVFSRRGSFKRKLNVKTA